METTANQITETIKQKGSNSAGIKHLSNISNKYKKLVDAGMTTPRGYNLMTITDTPKIKYCINR